MAEFSPMMQRYLETKKEYEDIGFNIVWKTCY